MTDENQGEGAPIASPARKTIADIVAEGKTQTPNRSAEPALIIGEVKAVGGYATWLRYSLYAYCLFCALTVVSDVLVLSYFDDVKSGAFEGGLRDVEAEGARIDAIGLIVVAGYLVAYISSVIAYCFFFQRSLKNLQSVDYVDRSYNPISAWGWYFVPILNLWKPVERFSDVRNGSRHAEGKKTDSGGLVAVWWISWIGLLIVTRISETTLTTGMETGNIDTLITGTSIEMGASTIGIVAAYLLARFVSEIARGQEQVQFMSNASAFD